MKDIPKPNKSKVRDEKRSFLSSRGFMKVIFLFYSATNLHLR
jgi:hypothetical protein